MRKSILFLTLFIATSSWAQRTPDTMIREFFGDYSNGKIAKAVDDLYAHSPWMTGKKDEIANLKRQLVGAVELLGEYHGYAMLGSKDVLSDLLAIDYFVKYDRQPIRLRFSFYRANKEWVLYEFSFDDRIDEELKEMLRNSYLHP